MPYDEMANLPKPTSRAIGEMRASPILLLLSNDEMLAELVVRIVKRPWTLVLRSADGSTIPKIIAQPNVRLVIFDDQAVAENERSCLLVQIRRHFSGVTLLYIADSHSDDNEKRARTYGAQYYVSRPMSPERFRQVLRSFLKFRNLRDTARMLRREGGAR